MKVSALRDSGPLRTAVIGGGAQAQAHRRAARRAGADVIAVVTEDPGSSPALAERCRVRPVAALDALPDLDLDVVHICAPTAVPMELAIAALDSGADIVCDFPVGANWADTEELAAVARELGRVAAVAFLDRYQPTLADVRGSRWTTDLGRWRLLHGSGYAGGERADAPAERVGPVALRTPSRLVDAVSRWCDLAEWVSGERIAAVAATMSDDTDHAALLLRSESGAVGAAVLSHGPGVLESRLYLQLDGDEPSGIPSLVEQAQAPVDAHDRSWAEFLGDTYAVIRGEHSDRLPTLEDAARSAHLADAVVRSAACGRWVDVEL